MHVIAPSIPEPAIPPLKTKRPNQFAFGGRYSVLLEISALILFCFTVLRIAMLLWFSDPGELSSAEFGLVFLTGLRFDVFAMLCCAFPQMIYLFAAWKSAETAATVADWTRSSMVLGLHDVV